MVDENEGYDSEEDRDESKEASTLDTIEKDDRVVNFLGDEKPEPFFFGLKKKTSPATKAPVRTSVVQHQAVSKAVTELRGNNNSEAKTTPDSILRINPKTNKVSKRIFSLPVPIDNFVAHHCDPAHNFLHQGASTCPKGHDQEQKSEVHLFG